MYAPLTKKSTTSKNPNELPGLGLSMAGNSISQSSREILQNYKSSGKAEEPVKTDETDCDETEYTLHNGEVICGTYEQSVIDGFNNMYDAIVNKDLVTTEVWNFADYLSGETPVGNYLVKYIQELPEAPEGYDVPETFALSGVKPTYDNARLYKDCGGNCYSTSASRINKAYEDLYAITSPIDYTQNNDKYKTFTSADYKTASTQKGAQNYGYGVGGALANGGEGTLVDNDRVWAGDLRPGAALQIWHTKDISKLGKEIIGGHSQIFLNYTYDENGVIDGMEVFDNSGTIIPLKKAYFEKYEYIRAANLNAK